MRRLRLPSFLRQRGWLLFITTATLTLLVLGLFLLPRFSNIYGYYNFEQQIRDRLAAAGRRAERNPEIVVVAIDSASVTLDELMGDELKASPALQLIKEGGYPFNRAVYGYAIQRLVEAGAKVVAFDQEYPGPREGDDLFRQALEKYGSHVVIGCNLLDAQSDEDNKTPIRVPSPSLIPDRPLRDDRVGFVNFRGDADFKVRRATFRTTPLDWFYPGENEEAPSDANQNPELLSLAARMAQKAGHADRIPRDRQQHLMRYSTGYATVSLYKLFLPELWERPPFNRGALFKDKIVLIGPYGNWAKDELLTPLGLTPGPLVHLTALNALLTGDYLHETTFGQNIALILGAGALAWILGRLISSTVLRLALLLGAGVGYVSLAFVLYDKWGLYPILLSPLLALVLSGGTWLVLERLLEALERRRLRQTLEQYVSRDVVKEVLDNPQSYLNTLGGQRKQIAVLFSDVRGFTTITESANPEELVDQLRQYFTEMVRIVFAEFGTLDKFIGDAVMALWGAITSRGPQKDACRAVSAAMQMLREVPKLNATWAAKGLPTFRIGIGVNYGEAICGRLGSDEKREFTAIGDAVNLASRLEGATKEFHVDILLGEATAALVKDNFTLRSVDLLKVKGKTKPVEVFTVLDVDGQGPPNWLEPYERGVKLYRKKEFHDAETAFQEAATQQPDDWLIQEYVRRCRDYQQTPPEPGWDGVHTMTKK